MHEILPVINGGNVFCSARPSTLHGDRERRVLSQAWSSNEVVNIGVLLVVCLL